MSKLFGGSNRSVALTAVLSVMSAVLMALHAQAEGINYSDGQSHDFAAAPEGTHVDSIELSNGSKLVLTGGDLYVDQSKVSVIGSSAITVKSGARLLCPTAAANGSFKFYGNSKLIVDGGYVRAPASSAKNSTCGAVNFAEEWTYWTPCYLEIRNGGTFEIDASSAGVASMFMARQSGILIDGNSTFKMTPNDVWGGVDRDYCFGTAPKLVETRF
ncbi:MAG: hypothetical protein KBT68_01580 [bacterium]|nr:hypothetical protein [Candidatus Colisoma equi]